MKGRTKEMKGTKGKRLRGSERERKGRQRTIICDWRGRGRRTGGSILLKGKG